MDFMLMGLYLDTTYKSFVGKEPVPIVYGMTIGEYALMIAGEKWMTAKANEKYAYFITTKKTADTPFHFQIIKCADYTHNSKYILPVRPSPNLPDIQSIYLYGSTCLFEGTVLSEGRGTDKPFKYLVIHCCQKIYTHLSPNRMKALKIPNIILKSATAGIFRGTPEEVLKEVDNKIQLKWLIEAYKIFPGKDTFFLKTNSLTA